MWLVFYKEGFFGFLVGDLYWNMVKLRGLGFKRVVFYKVYEIWYVLTWETDQLYNLTGNPAECDHNKIPLPKIKCYAIVYVNFGWFPSWLCKKEEVFGCLDSLLFCEGLFCEEFLNLFFDWIKF